MRKGLQEQQEVASLPTTRGQWTRAPLELEPATCSRRLLHQPGRTIALARRHLLALDATVRPLPAERAGPQAVPVATTVAAIDNSSVILARTGQPGGRLDGGDQETAIPA